MKRSRSAESYHTAVTADTVDSSKRPKTDSKKMYAAMLRYGSKSGIRECDDTTGNGVIVQVVESKNDASKFLIDKTCHLMANNGTPSDIRDAVDSCKRISASNGEDAIALLRRVSIVLQYREWPILFNVYEFTVPLGLGSNPGPGSGPGQPASYGGVLLLHNYLSIDDAKKLSIPPQTSIAGVFVGPCTGTGVDAKVPDFVFAAEVALQAKLVQDEYQLESPLKDKIENLLKHLPRGEFSNDEKKSQKPMDSSQSLSLVNKYLKEGEFVSNGDLLEYLKDALTFGRGAYSWTRCHRFQL